MRFSFSTLFLKGIFLLSLIPGLFSEGKGDMCLRLPTENQALFQGKPEDFYMYVDRMKDGVNLRPWTGGTYGFVRTVVETPQGPICAKFHEGIDIKPLKRDAQGVPLDEVRPIAPGKVVHVNDVPGHSSYGRYIVIEHRDEDIPFYSLYAHLGKTSCSIGDMVGTGNVLGILGYSGVGLNRERSHVHVELGLLINPYFEQWYDRFNSASPNRNGLYNGLNIAGLDLAPLLEKCKDGARINLAEHIRSLDPFYTVRVPGGEALPLTKMYPFLLKPGPCAPQNARSWDISFTGTGVPVSVTPSSTEVTEPTLVWKQSDEVNPLYRSVYRVKSLGGGRFGLSGSGQRYVALYLFGRNPEDLQPIPKK